MMDTAFDSGAQFMSVAVARLRWAVMEQPPTIPHDHGSTGREFKISDVIAFKVMIAPQRVAGKCAAGGAGQERVDVWWR